MRRRDEPATIDPLPQLGLQADPAAVEARDGDDDCGILIERTVLDPLDRARRDATSHAAEGADRVMADEQARGIAAHRVRAGCEGGIEGVEVVGQDGALVVLECDAEVVGQLERSCGGHGTPMKSASRMRA